MSIDLDRIEGSGVYDISRAEWRRENVLPCNFIALPETDREREDAKFRSAWRPSPWILTLCGVCQ